jgi:CheY-like chemotaxis protein
MFDDERLLGCLPLRRKINDMSAPIILYVENNYYLRLAVKDVLELAGWQVEECSNSGYAVAMMRLHKYYSLLLIDNEISGVDGLALVKEARRIEHLKQTPIVLFSIKDCADEARSAGANEFLQKPNNIVAVVDIIRSLLAAKSSA